MLQASDVSSEDSEETRSSESKTQNDFVSVWPLQRYWWWKHGWLDLEADSLWFIQKSVKFYHITQNDSDIKNVGESNL